MVHRCDVRNNLILLERYLPQPLRGEYRRDWIQRYGALARANGCRAAHWRGCLEGLMWRAREANRRRRSPRVLDAATIERVFELNGQARQIAQWSRRHGVRSVLIADFSKNLYATWRGCRETGLTARGICDNGPAFAGCVYRGLPVRPDDAWSHERIDGIVLSNVNPAQVEARGATLRERFKLPTLHLWHSQRLRALPSVQAA